MNALTNYGESTLLGATAHGDYELIKLLLQPGVYINLVNAQGQNARTHNLAQNPSVHARTLSKYSVWQENSALQ